MREEWSYILSWENQETKEVRDTSIVQKLPSPCSVKTFFPAHPFSDGANVLRVLAKYRGFRFNPRISWAWGLVSCVHLLTTAKPASFLLKEHPLGDCGEMWNLDWSQIYWIRTCILPRFQGFNASLSGRSTVQGNHTKSPWESPLLIPFSPTAQPGPKAACILPFWFSVLSLFLAFWDFCFFLLLSLAIHLRRYLW